MAHPPTAAVPRERIESLLYYATLAPSSHNTQPWQFTVSGNRIRVLLDESRWLRIADPDQRELHISIGCCLENLMVAAAYFGHQPQLAYFPEEDNPRLAAEILLQPESPGAADSALFEAIPRRRTSHRLFHPRPLPKTLQQRIQESCTEEGIQLFLTEDAEIRRRVEQLAVEADALQFSDPAFRHELGEWIGRGVFGAPWLVAKLGQLAVTYLDIGVSMGKKDVDRIESAPVLGLITSSGDDRTSQIKAGRVFEAIYLAATVEGLSLQPMSQLCEIASIRGQLARLTPKPGLYPQQPFRLGYADPEPGQTPRRPLDEVLCWS
jgi:nitroreductase